MSETRNGGVNDTATFFNTSNQDNSVDSQEPKPLLRASTTFYDRVIMDWWWWELGSWLISFACVTTIIGLLFYYDGKKQPSHVVKGITLNAFIAVFAAVAKAALILPVSEAIGQLKWIWFREERRLVDFYTFDNASRGPWGSTILLYKTKGRHLVSVGAAITVLALAFEPFFQQSVSYSNHIVVTDSGTLTVASSFSPAQDTQSGIRSQYDSVRGTAERTLALHIADAILGKEEPKKSVPSICPTGKCTWPPHSSLGVCHRCQDVSHLLLPVCQRENMRKADASGLASYPCGYHINGTLLTGIAGTWERYTISLSTLLVGTDSRNGRRDYWNSTHFRNAPYAISNFYVAYVPGGDSQVLRNATPAMVECLFQWCVKTIQSSHRDGRLEETVLSTYLPPDTPSTLSTFGFAPNNPFSMMAEGKSFTVGANTTSSIYSSLLANVPKALTNETLDATGQWQGKWNFLSNVPYDVNSVLVPIADTISDYLRSSANTGAEQIIGDAYGLEPFVETQWLWILLPCALLLGTLVLIYGTIIKSRRDSVPSWKSSALATLLHGLTEEVRDQFGPNASQSEVEAIARKIHVKISLKSAAGTLVAADSSFGHD